MHLHIDGDVIKYRAGFAAEKMQYTLLGHGEPVQIFQYKKDLDKYVKEHGLEVRPSTEEPQKTDFYQVQKERIAEPVENALHNVKKIIEDIMQNMGTNDVTVYLSGPTNYRTSVGDIIYTDHPCPGYKANRKDAHRPVHGPAIVDYIVKHYPVNISEDEEADDAMGISHYCMWLRDTDSSCIVTIDKDLDMIPGHHYNFVKDEQYNIDSVTADTVFWRQLLTGDNTDNIPGIKGLGPKTAEKLIEWNMEPQDCYEICLEKYGDYYGKEKAAQALLENARMIWIRREPDEFWNPPV